MKKEKDSTGLGLKTPAKACEDKHCGFHGAISLRGRQFIGTIKKVSGHRTATVEWQRLFYLPKYQRYEKRGSKLHVHNPDCVDVKVGDKVRFVECRPISKTKNFIIVEKL